MTDEGRFGTFQREGDTDTSRQRLERAERANTALWVVIFLLVVALVALWQVAI